MADAAFATAKFPAFTTAELKARVASGNGSEEMAAEIERRQRVAAGDVSVMTAGERLRHGRELTASTAKAIASLNS